MISSVPKFINPKPELEQYLTPPRIVASIIVRAFQLGDVFGKDIYDLCAGTGIFAKAASLMGARRTVSVEIDKKQLSLAKEWMKEETKNHFVNADLRYFSGRKLNTVFMNPPFGIQGKNRDIIFLKKALELADIVYSVHFFTSKNKTFLENWVKKNGRNIEETITYEFELPRQFYFHKKNKKITKTLVLRITT